MGGLFQCRTRLCGWCNLFTSRQTRRKLRFNAARGFVGGATFVMNEGGVGDGGFNAARGFVGGATKPPRTDVKYSCKFQCRTRLCGWCNFYFLEKGVDQNVVSMPHAALWVVQRRRRVYHGNSECRFNAARGFVGGATLIRI